VAKKGLSFPGQQYIQYRNTHQYNDKGINDAEVRAELVQGTHDKILYKPRPGEQAEDDGIKCPVAFK
jgi:hypothetical protein